MTPIEAWRDYVTGVVRLMVWYAHRLAHRPVAPVPVLTALDVHVDIMRKTELFDGRHPADGLDPPIPAWDGLKHELAARITAHQDGHDTGPLEDACWTVLEPLMEQRLGDAPRATHPFECWGCDLTTHEPVRLDLHLCNAYQPESPFGARRQELMASLLRCLRERGAEHAHLTEVECDSWLTQYPPFDELFPPEWAASFVPTYATATYGFWGQYMDHRGAFNEARARQLRQTGTHPYHAGLCWCTIDAAMTHLESLLSARGPHA